MTAASVYILASRRNGTLYVGVTTQLIGRISAHRARTVPGFTAKYGVDRLVHVEHYDDIATARRREAALKRWRRVWKIELIERDNPEWRDLAESLIE
jgi:putative endonuclease